jgi:hypothetical protein
MKHLLNNLSEQEKSSIISQHKGGIEIETKNFKNLLEHKSGSVKPLLMEQGTSVKISVAKEGWAKLPDDICNITSESPVCTYSGYYYSFKYNNIYYDCDLSGIISGVRGGEGDSLENMHKLLTEGIVKGEFVSCRIKELVTPIRFNGKQFMAQLNGVPGNEALPDVKPDDMTKVGGFHDTTTKNQTIFVNVGGEWKQYSLTFEKLKVNSQTSGGFDKTYFEKNTKGTMVIDEYGQPKSINGTELTDSSRQFGPFFQQGDGFGRGFNSGNFNYEYKTTKTMRNPSGELVIEVKNNTSSAMYFAK